MIPIYQTFIDGKRGNCMQAVMASLFELSLEKVPNFIELGDEWHNSMCSFIYDQGYELLGTLYNPNDFYAEVVSPKDIIPECRFEEMKTKYKGINGYYYAAVFSQKFYDPSKSWINQITHAVVVDSNLNIVHDPNRENKSNGYLRSNEIGYNGVLYTYIIEKR